MNYVRHMKPTRGDIASVSVGMAVPFIMGADAQNAATLPQMAVAAAATAAAGLIVKTLAVAVGAALRGYRDVARGDKDPKNDAWGVIADRVADAVDPEHTDKNLRRPTAEELARMRAEIDKEPRK